MKRTVAALIMPLTLGLLPVPLTADAQPTPKIPRIDVLGRTPASAGSFRQALRNLGYREGQTIAIEYRWAEDQLECLSDLAAELVRLQPDLLVAISHRVAPAAKEVTTTIPIVFVQVNESVGVGLVPSLAHPGANVTGASLQCLDLIGKRLQLLKEALPGLAHLAYLRNPTEPYSAAYWRGVQDAVRALGVNRLLSLEVQGPDEFEGVFAELTRARPDAVIVEPNALN
jgi:putative tryptophan/tyrosine transport system substrate-binding protein